MSKTLLSESEIKDFMKYANLNKETTNSFIERLNEHSLAEQEGDEPEEEAPEEEEGPEGEEAAPAEEPEEPGAAGEDAGVEAAVEMVLSKIVDAIGEIPGAPEVSMDADAGAAGGEDMDAMAGDEEMPEPAPEEGGEEDAEDAEVAAMMEAINLYMEEDGGEYDAMMEEEELDEMGMHYDEEEPDMMEGGMYEEEEDLQGMGMYEEEDPEGYYDGAMEEELVSEVTRRVAKRILGASKKSRRR